MTTAQRIGSVAAAVILVVTGSLWLARGTVEPPAGSGPYEVTKVTDGDTIRTQQGEVNEPVRLLGINTPERGECYAGAATDALHALIADRPVLLVADPSQGDRDRYSRQLRYVEVDGRDVGYELILAGMALEATFDGQYERQAAYRAAQEQAKAANRGGWAACR